MIKKFIALILAALMLTLTACGGDKADDNPSDITPSNDSTAEYGSELQLLYCANDTMNPFTTISKLNAELGLLIFDSLVKVDNSFETVYSLAKEVKTEGKLCTVTLKDALFTDGSRVTADDILYSYNTARSSKRFSDLFYEVEKAEVIDSSTIAFTLSKNDPYFEKLLTFPIIKSGSDKLKNEDNVELIPIGCGRYVFSDDGSYLVQNESYFGASGSIKKINLISAPDTESMEHYVEIGATDIYYAELNDESIIRMSSKKSDVNLNNLIYIGINHNYAPLQSAELRYAISSAISRKEIVSKAFYSNAVASTGFFHPVWQEVSDYQSIVEVADKKISIENLGKIGYNRLNADGFYENSKGKIVELTLLVNKESASKLAAAELIASQLAAAGIKLNIKAVSKDSYFSSLKSGSFQLYLGEIKLLPNMDISALVLSGGSASYGIASPVPEASEENEQDSESEDETDDAVTEDTASFDSETFYASVIEGFYQGDNTIIDVASALQASMPIIPLAYRNSLVFYSNDIEDVFSPSYCDIFISIDKYKIKK